MFSTLLIALPMMALIVGATLMTGVPPMRERALRSIPEGAQAVITATAVKRDGNPFEQPPEGASIWMDEITQQPASEDELKRIVPSSDKLLPYWDSEQLIATTSTGLQPGQVESAKNSSIGGTLAQSGTGTARLCEAGAEALGMLLPKLSEGTVPSNTDEIVVTSGLASRIGADVGDTITLIAPPFQGSYSTNGRIAAVIQNSQRAWRISGIVADDAISKAWARDGWMSGMVADDGGAGVDRHYLVVGDKPITWRQVKKMNLLQTVAVSRHVLTDGYPNASERYPSRIDGQALLQYAVGFIVAVAMGVALVLCMVTPAFSISVDQSRRTMGLASACGAGPRDVRNMFGLQGVCSGFAGGVIGMLAGIGGIYVMAPSVIHVDVHEIPQVIPWGLLPLVVMTSTLIGTFATWMPARRAGRMSGRCAAGPSRWVGTWALCRKRCRKDRADIGAHTYAGGLRMRRDEHAGEGFGRLFAGSVAGRLRNIPSAVGRRHRAGHDWPVATGERPYRHIWCGRSKPALVHTNGFA